MVCEYLNKCNVGQSAMDLTVFAKIGGRNLTSFCMGEGECGKNYKKMKEGQFELMKESGFEGNYFFPGGGLI